LRKAGTGEGRNGRRQEREKAGTGEGREGRRQGGGGAGKEGAD
jgi:hypothetical protein